MIGFGWLQNALLADALTMLFFLLSPQELPHAQGYLQPPVVVRQYMSGHCPPQHRSNNAIIWGAYDMWLLRGGESWLQCVDVHPFYVLLVCRKFWF
eukprot:COSAG01_NODE_3224_length_6388_cov_10.896009_1_plen_96_part_00